MRGKIITVTSMKGGVGKTETALSLAVAIRKETGRRTIIVDFDIPYGGVAQALALGKESSISDWIRTNRIISEEAIKSLVISHQTGLDLLPTVASASDITRFTGEVAERILQQLASCYDYVVVDTGVDLSPSTQSALISADRIVVVTAPHNVSIWNNHQYKEDLVNLGVNPLKISLLINQIRKNQDIDITDVVHLFKTSGAPIQQIYMASDDERIRKLRDLRESIVISLPKSDLSIAIFQMLSDFGIVPNAITIKKGTFGLFERMRRLIAR
ncbi:CpaE family protein [Brevibacillus sp. NPDC003359]|uniref:AAA family ATPase n=1 Tax=unclassified Brevibacillus TaxID=2684853 RepID=UPI0036855D0C